MTLINEPVNREDNRYRPITPLYQWPLVLAIFLSILILTRYMGWRLMKSVQKRFFKKGIVS